MSSIAIITARSGSKRIPNKNIREFCGKPIITYSISAALNSGIFNEVMVSTDSEEIAEIALQNGAEVPFMRSESNSNDYATTADVLKEVISQYERFGKTFENVACIYPTAPFITGEKLKKAMQILQTEDADAVIPVVKYNFPPQRAFVLHGKHLVYKYPEYSNMRSQDLEPMYHDSGQFYVFKTCKFTKYLTMIMPLTLPLVIPEEEAQDIDTLSDWALAEVKYRALRHQ